MARIKSKLEYLDVWNKPFNTMIKMGLLVGYCLVHVVLGARVRKDGVSTPELGRAPNRRYTSCQPQVF